jgi:hypothetical protein
MHGAEEKVAELEGEPDCIDAIIGYPYNLNYQINNFAT